MANARLRTSRGCFERWRYAGGASMTLQRDGTINGFKDLDSAASRPTAKGVWNDLEIRVEGHTYTVVRYGVVINEYENVPGVYIPGRPNDVVSFRNIRIKDLSDHD